MLSSLVPSLASRLDHPVAAPDVENQLNHPWPVSTQANLVLGARMLEARDRHLVEVTTTILDTSPPIR